MLEILDLLPGEDPICQHQKGSQESPRSRKVTGNPVVLSRRPEDRLLPCASLDRYGAPSAEPAATRRIDGARDVSLENNALRCSCQRRIPYRYA